MQLIEQVEREFVGRYGKLPLRVIAPGRVNLIGEHTDYNEGWVMPGATDRHVALALAVNGTNTCRVFAMDYRQAVEFLLDELRPGAGWVHYLMGVLHGMRQIGFPLQGVDCVIASTIPVGAGLSSSAALCCGFGYAVSEACGYQLAKLAIAKVAQYAEHHFAGVRCGLMDQYASLFGVTDAALLLDCRTLTHEEIPARFDRYQLLLIDTKVKHALGDTAYNERRAACEAGVRTIQKKYPLVTSLRDVTNLMLLEHQDDLGQDIFAKCRYVVEEMTRTQRAAHLLKQHDLNGFGACMFETHWGLSRTYEVSCPELDLLVTLAEDEKDAIVGARMMGGGFGGCTINLVKKDKIDFIKGYVHEKYFATFEIEPDFYQVDLSRGVHQVT
jgi:galactokinase